MRKEFIKCGVVGCCMELLWTTFCGAKKKDYRLVGQTSLWMFPIYGMASIIKPISCKLKKHNRDVIERGIIYTMGIYTIEYTSGMFLKKNNRCPWDYSKSKYHINGVVRLDYAPLWFLVGLIYEKILEKNNWSVHH